MNIIYRAKVQRKKEIPKTFARIGTKKSAKKIVVPLFESPWWQARHKNLAFSFGDSIKCCIFAASLVSPMGRSGRSYFMRKTFSNVCRCGLRTSQTRQHPHSRQMTTKRLRGTFLYTIIIYSSCWRGLTALSILCGKGNAKARYARMGKETDTHAFFVS